MNGEGFAYFHWQLQKCNIAQCSICRDIWAVRKWR